MLCTDYKGKLLSNKKEENTNTHKMDEPQNGYAEQMKPDTSAYCMMAVTRSGVMAVQGWDGQALMAKGVKGNVLYHDPNGSYMGADICQNPLNELLKWVNFITYKLYLSKVA